MPAEAGAPTRCAITRMGPTRLAALGAACRLKPAFQAVRVTSAVEIRAGNGPPLHVE